jgi:hypothetical protein
LILAVSGCGGDKGPSSSETGSGGAPAGQFPGAPGAGNAFNAAGAAGSAVGPANSASGGSETATSAGGSGSGGRPISGGGSGSSSGAGAGKCPDLLLGGESTGGGPISGNGTSTITIDGTTTQPAVQMCRVLRNVKGDMVAYFVRFDGHTLLLPDPTHGDPTPYHGDGTYNEFLWDSLFTLSTGTVTVSNQGTTGVASFTNQGQYDVKWTCDPTIPVDRTDRMPMGTPTPGTGYLIDHHEGHLDDGMVLWLDHLTCEHLQGLTVRAPPFSECDDSSRCPMYFNMDLDKFKSPYVPGMTSGYFDNFKYYGITRAFDIGASSSPNVQIDCDQTLHGTLSGGWTGAFNCPKSD